MAQTEKKKFKPYRVTVKKQSRRHVGREGTAVAETPHGVLVRLDDFPHNKEVLDSSVLSR